MDIDGLASGETALAELLVSGGDSRLVVDPRTGRNRYHCSPLPAPDVACFASCTASPISRDGFRAAGEALGRLGSASRLAITGEAVSLAATLRGLLGLDGIAEVLLTPSGTDATLLATGLLAAEAPWTPIVSIMVAASETGSGVPLAAAGCHFSEQAAGRTRVPQGALIQGYPPGTRTCTIAMRYANGAPRPMEEVDADFLAAAASAPGRPVVHLMDGSKTGLIAPSVVPGGVDVIVDACQARLPLERLHQYLLWGWPVLITGSKFFGGPAFSGAVLFPVARLATIDRYVLPPGLAAYGIDPASAQPAANVGTVLRWAAAIEEMTRFATRPAAEMRARLETLATTIAARVAASPGLVPLDAPGQDDGTEAWPRSIQSFAVRDRADPTRLLSVAELRAHHRALAAAGVLVGQPVEFGTDYGALRIAIGARMLQEVRTERELRRLFTALGRL